jgi:8-oxo-dGTP pyrophosphatase MutT (NUDIX family)
MARELSAGGVVLRPGPGGVEVLLGEQTDWNSGESTVRLPKGHLEPGESTETAAVREVREETGRRATIRSALRDVHYSYENRRTGDRIEKTVVFFLMDDCGEDPSPRDDEMERVFWVPLDEARAQLSFESERSVIAEALERLGTAHEPQHSDRRSR